MPGKERKDKLEGARVVKEIGTISTGAHHSLKKRQDGRCTNQDMKRKKEGIKKGLRKGSTIILGRRGGKKREKDPRWGSAGRI